MTWKTRAEQEMEMIAKGEFEIDLLPQDDPDHPVGRMLINKSYSGDLVGSGIGQMISKRTDTGEAAYCAIEEFSGSLHDRSGGFTLVHKGQMSQSSQSLEVQILNGSGSGELQTISGSLDIIQDVDGHRYELAYEL
jgi:hypothetical protein